MRTGNPYALPLAGVLAVVASGCASRRASTSNPAASRVEASQRQSEEALASAADAQEGASEQQKRAAEAQEEVRESQRRLEEAQQRAEQETAKAQQSQQQANQATQQATQDAQQSQQQASQQLAQETLVRRGEQVLAGQVQRASPSQLVVQPHGGEEMTFQITDRTQVQIDGLRASASDITQGEDARVSYEMSGAQPTAVLVQVVTGNPSGSVGTAGATGAGAGTTTPPADTGMGAGSGTSTPPASEMGGTGSTGDAGAGAGTGGTSGTATPPERRR